MQIRKTMQFIGNEIDCNDGDRMESEKLLEQSFKNAEKYTQ